MFWIYVGKISAMVRGAAPPSENVSWVYIITLDFLFCNNLSTFRCNLCILGALVVQ